MSDRRPRLLVAVLANMNQPGTFATGDFNADGQVTFADYQLLEANYGKQSPDFTPAEFTTAPTFATDATAVPEPATMSLMTLAVAATLCRRQRRASHFSLARYFGRGPG